MRKYLFGMLVLLSASANAQSVSDAELKFLFELSNTECAKDVCFENGIRFQRWTLRYSGSQPVFVATKNCSIGQCEGTVLLKEKDRLVRLAEGAPLKVDAIYAAVAAIKEPSNQAAVRAPAKNVPNAKPKTQTAVGKTPRPVTEATASSNTTQQVPPLSTGLTIVPDFECSIRMSARNLDVNDARPSNSVRFTITQTEVPRLLSDKSLTSLLDALRQSSDARCHTNSAEIQSYEITGYPPNSAGFFLYAQFITRQNRWIVNSNLVRAEVEQKQAALRTNEIAQNNRVMFFSKAGIQKLISPEELRANPFIYKGQVVGVRVLLMQMVAENEALFSQASGDPTLYATSVPSTSFRAGSMAVLAVRIVGVRTTKIGVFGEIVLPHGEYVDAFHCGSFECKEFFN